MSKSTVIIDAQYYENYNVGPEGFGEKPYWKPKGGHKFQIEMDIDILMYCQDAPKAFQKMLDKHETIAERFEYIGYEILWQEPSLLGTEDDFLNAAYGNHNTQDNVIAGVDFSKDLENLNNLSI